ncbi:hypothetical protein F5Y14DRAFT_431321 [Nemania sp. NC0429]|nr:hypothetical protein F5Y14DRAFT_431321 [Nemania sp. NC0429]
MSEQAQLPSYEELRRAADPVPIYSPEADRIYWTLNGPLHSSIWFLSHGSLKPYAQGTDESNLTWHPISQYPLTEPKISSITVSVSPLDDWEGDWLELHRRHADPDPRSNYCESRWGPLPDYIYIPDPDREEEPEGRGLHLLECCGFPRPRHIKSSIVVKPSPGNEFITIHDYLSTVHPFLLESRQNILSALGVLETDCPPPETKLVVSHFANSLMVCCEDPGFKDGTILSNGTIFDGGEMFKKNGRRFSSPYHEDNYWGWWSCKRRTRQSHVADGDETAAEGYEGDVKYQP